MLLQSEISTLQSFIEKGDILKENISQKSSYWQIDHTLKVIQAICKLMHESDPKEYKPKFSVVKWVIMLTGNIPRGKGRAPKPTMATEVVSKEDLLSQIEKTIEVLKSMDTIHKGAFFKHPLFGDFNTKNSKRFMQIHTLHHIKIIQDIYQ